MKDFGCGKAILLGEHAVVHGTPALAAGLGRGVSAWADAAERTSLVIPAWDLVLERDADHDLGRALRAILEAHPLGEVPALRIEADVELPGGSGLGCSAALGVAVLRAVDRASGHEASDAEVAERALAWERVFHGNPSGIDNTMAAHGGVALYIKGAPLEPVDVRQPLTLVVGNSGEPSSTKEMVASVARQKERDPARFEQTLEAITALVRNARFAIEAGDHRGLGQLMDLNQALLSSWMLSTPSLEDMCGAARDAGAHGAKITGAGGGGCMIAVVDAERAEAVTDAIRATGREAFSAQVGSEDLE